MKAKTVNENVNFERGQDPKEAMGIGIKDFYGFVKFEAEKHGLDPDDFWEERYEYARDEKGNDILEELYDVLSHTPLDYQISYIEDNLKYWIEENE